MHVHLRRRGLHRVDDAQVGVAGVRRVDAALHAHLGGAALPGLAHAARDLGGVEVVGRIAVALLAALGEGAELAAEGADVRVVDVAVDDEAHRVAALAPRAAHRPRGTHGRSPRRGPGTGARCPPRPAARRRPPAAGWRRRPARRGAGRRAPQAVDVGLRRRQVRRPRPSLRRARGLRRRCRAARRHAGRRPPSARRQGRSGDRSSAAPAGACRRRGSRARAGRGAATAPRD